MIIIQKSTSSTPYQKITGNKINKITTQSPVKIRVTNAFQNSQPEWDAQRHMMLVQSFVKNSTCLSIGKKNINQQIQLKKL